MYIIYEYYLQKQRVKECVTVSMCIYLHQDLHQSRHSLPEHGEIYSQTKSNMN